MLIPTTDLQENSNHSQAVGFTGSISKIGILGVPVHQVELGKQKSMIRNNSLYMCFESCLLCVCHQPPVCQEVQAGVGDDSQPPHLSRILGPGHRVFRASVVTAPPVEVELLEPVGP